MRRRSPADEFEVVIVDDCSSDETAAVLAAEAERGELRLAVIRQPENRGRASAREAGWRAAAAELIAFTDDDCVPAPDWLERGLSACAARPGAIVQGRTEPDPGQLDRLGPFSRTIEVSGYDAAFQTCNIFYPRPVLERVGGFDTEAFGRVHGGEDSDLAWRAIEAGTAAGFDPRPLVHHAVNELGALGKIRLAAGWSLLAYARHPELRRASFATPLFWKHTHIWLARALLGLLVPRRLWPLRALARAPLAPLARRPRQARGRRPEAGAVLRGL